MGVGGFCIWPNTMVYCAIQVATVTCAIQSPIQLSPFNGELKYLLPGLLLLQPVFQVCIRSEHAIGYLKGCFQLLQGLQQQINSECDHTLALAWVWACVIIHSFAACIEDSEYEADFWEWVNEGMQGQGDEEEDEPVDAFVWTGARSPHPGESDGQQKCQLIQEALFNALYP